MAHREEYLERISASLDGALSSEEQKALEVHLAQCAECRALYEELSALHAALGALPAVEAPDDLTQRIMDAVAEEQILPFAPAEQKKAPIRWQKWLASAAVVTLVLAGTWAWKPWERNSASDMAPAAMAGAAAEQAPAQTGDPAEAVPEAALDTEGIPAPAEKAAPMENSASYKAAEAPAEGASAPSQERAVVSGSQPDQTPAPEENVTPMVRMAREPMLGAAPEGDTGGDVPAPQLGLFSAPAPSQSSEDPEENASQTVLDGSAAPTAAATPREALDRLLTEYPMPEDAALVDADGMLGWETPSSPVEDGSGPNAPQVSTRLEYVGTSPNGKYHEFWLSSFLVDDPETGLAHSSTINFFAVPLEVGDILVQRTEDPESPEAYQAGIDAYLQATTE